MHADLGILWLGCGNIQGRSGDIAVKFLGHVTDELHLGHTMVISGIVLNTLELHALCNFYFT